MAIVTCTSECNVGNSFSLDYLGHVPLGGSSGFGGVYYTVHLEGVIESGSALPPTKSVSIKLTGGSSHECASPEGSIIEATASIITTDVNDIVSVNWTLDGDDAGVGETVNVSSSLGEHTLNVFVDTLASGIFDSSTSVTVNDHTAPELDIVFVDGHSGAEITEVTGDGRHLVTVRYDVVDVCDSEATASGVAVPVHAVDASGNNRHRSATY